MQLAESSEPRAHPSRRERRGRRAGLRQLPPRTTRGCTTCSARWSRAASTATPSPTSGNGERVMIEFVSANPTGPLHVGNGWFASYGDALARLLRAHRSRGHPRVLRERHRRPDPALRCEHPGSQARPARSRGRLSRSVRRGPRRRSTTGPTTLLEAGRWAAERILGDIRTTLESIHIHYDEWYSQASIEESEAVAETVDVLPGKGLVFEEDGATWLRTADFGDPREKRVLRQVERRLHLSGRRHRLPPQQVPDPWLRPCHRRVGRRPPGQVPSLKAGVEALGVDRGRLEVRLGQMVSLASGSHVEASRQRDRPRRPRRRHRAPTPCGCSRS